MNIGSLNHTPNRDRRFADVMARFESLPRVYNTGDPIADEMALWADTDVSPFRERLLVTV